MELVGIYTQQESFILICILFGRLLLYQRMQYLPDFQIPILFTLNNVGPRANVDTREPAAKYLAAHALMIWSPQRILCEPTFFGPVTALGGGIKPFLHKVTNGTPNLFHRQRIE